MARASLLAGAAFAGAIVYLRADGKLGLRFQYRPGESELLRTISPGAVMDQPPAWLRLERRGKTLTGEYSIDGESWTELGRQDLEGFPPAVQVGVAAADKRSSTLPPPSAFEALQVRLSKVELESLPGLVFLRGEANDDGKVDISDAVHVLNWLFLGEAEPGCLAAADVHGDKTVNISDPVYLLSHLFLGGPPPPAPFPECGPLDPPAEGSLGCKTAPKGCP
jgi:hypothetical protein